MRKTDNVQLHTSRLFRSLYFIYLSHLYPFLTPLANRLEIQFPSQPPESCRLCSPSSSACCFVVTFAFSSACLSLCSGFLPLLLGVLVRFVPEDVPVVDAANVFLAHDAVLVQEEEVSA